LQCYRSLSVSKHLATKLAAILVCLALSSGCAPERASVSPGRNVGAIDAGSNVTKCVRYAIEASNREPIAEPDRMELASRFRDQESLFAGLLAGKRGQLLPHATPFLTRGNIWDFQDWDPHHGGLARIGAATTGPAVHLNTSESLVVFATRAGLNLANNDARVTYVKTYLWLNPEVQYLVESLSDLHFSVSRDADAPRDRDLEKVMGSVEYQKEFARSSTIRREVEARFGSIFAALCMTGTGPFYTTAYVVYRSGSLVQVEVTLEASGRITTRQQALAEHLPVMMGGR
jgi:hypothetical protein